MEPISDLTLLKGKTVQEATTDGTETIITFEDDTYAYFWSNDDIKLITSESAMCYYLLLQAGIIEKTVLDAKLKKLQDAHKDDELKALKRLIDKYPDESREACEK